MTTLPFSISPTPAWLARLAALALSALLAGATLAAPLSAADEKTVRAVVQGQLDAFAKDDAKKAFSYAAPNVREAVGSAENFMTMVRQGYPVVYRNRAVSFLKPEAFEDQVIQRVQLTDTNGDSWLASYALQRQKDKSWRITACVVVEAKGRFV